GRNRSELCSRTSAEESESAPRECEQQADEEREPGGPELEEEPEIGVLDEGALERVEAVDEDLVLRAEAVTRHRPLRRLIEGAVPGLRAAARAEDRSRHGRPVRPREREADLVLEPARLLRVDPAGVRGAPLCGRRGRRRGLLDRLRDLPDLDARDREHTEADRGKGSLPRRATEHDRGDERASEAGDGRAPRAREGDL